MQSCCKHVCNQAKNGIIRADSAITYTPFGCDYIPILASLSDCIKKQLKQCSVVFFGAVKGTSSHSRYRSPTGRGGMTTHCVVNYGSIAPYTGYCSLSARSSPLISILFSKRRTIICPSFAKWCG